MSVLSLFQDEVYIYIFWNDVEENFQVDVNFKVAGYPHEMHHCLFEVGYGKKKHRY